MQQHTHTHAHLVNTIICMFFFYPPHQQQQLTLSLMLRGKFKIYFFIACAFSCSFSECIRGHLNIWHKKQRAMNVNPISGWTKSDGYKLFNTICTPYIVLRSIALTFYNNQSITMTPPPSPHHSPLQPQIIAKNKLYKLMNFFKINNKKKIQLQYSVDLLEKFDFACLRRTKATNRNVIVILSSAH